MKNFTQRWLLSLFLITSMAFSASAQYCEGSVTSTFDTNVEQVDITGDGTSSISFTGCPGVAGLEDHTDLSVDVTANSTYTLDITFGTCGGDYNAAAEIWIDWNKDFVFDPLTESFGTSTGKANEGSWIAPVSFSITVPADAGNGLTRMRIMQKESGFLPLDPCESFYYGSIMDFSINVSGGLDLCSPPIMLDAINILNTSADILWAESGNSMSWDVEWGLQGFELGSGTLVTELTDTFLILSDLAATSVYSFYVQAECESDWSGPYSFMTACDIFTVLPYVETFNSESFTENCWTVLNENGDGDQWDLNYTTNTFEGDQVAAMYTDYNSGNNDDYLISPQITLTGNQRLKFNFRTQSTYEPNDFEVLISTTTSDPASFTDTLLENASYSSLTYIEQVIDLSAYTGDVYVAFRVAPGGLDGWRLYIDEVIFEEIPSCPKPTELDITNITPFSADAYWLTGGAIAWHIEYGEQDFEQGTGLLVELTDTFYTIPDLTPETTYEYYARDSCDVGDLSVWNGPYTFTTDISCYPPSDLGVLNIDLTSATAIWNSEDTETNWNIEYGTYGFELGTGTAEAVTDTFFNFIDLNASTSYDYYVQANCEGIDGISVWEGPFTFETLCEVFSDYPYTQDFDGTWGCWTVIDFDEDGTTWTQDNSYITAHSGEFIADGMGNSDDYLISPKFVIDEAMWVKWWVKKESNSYDNSYEVLLSTTTNDSAGLTTVLATYETVSANWTEITFDLAEYAGDTVYIAFHQTFSGSTYYGFGIDDFVIEYIPTCFEPTNLNAINIDGYNADVLWNTGGASNWNIEYGEAGFELGTGIFYEAVDTFMNISGLTPVTNYEFYVQDSCGVEDESYWAGPFSFTTTVSCPAPYGVITNVANAYDVSLSWNAASADNWNIEFGDLGFVQGEGTFMEVADTFYTIESLIPETSYHFYVQDSCGTDDESVWVGPYVFTTIATCPIPTEILVVPTDTSAVISWVSAGASNWNLEFGEQGFVQGEGTFLELTETTYEMEDLMSETSYTFYVQDSCAADDASYWVGPITFTTLMMPLSNPTECNVGIASVDNNCIYIPMLIEGVMEGEVLREFHFIAEHTYDGDLDISLQSPNGTIIELSTDNGSSGENFGINDTTCTQFTNFKMNGQDGLIVDGDDPYLGSFIPEGNFNDFTAGENLNGIWIIHFCDDAGGDDGQFLHGELVFGEPLITEAEFTEYSIVGQDSSAIFPENDSILVYMPQGTYDLNGLVAEFVLSDSASAKVVFTEQVSGVTPNHWTSAPVVYIVTAEDLTVRNWKVHINVPQFTENDFMEYTIYNQDSSNIDLENRIINVYMPSGTDYLSALVAIYEASDGSTVMVGSVLQQSNLTENNWEDGTVEYVITAENGSQETWTVNVIVNLFIDTDILTYTIPGQLGATIYNLENHSIEIVMNQSITNISDREADFTISEGATAHVGSIIQISGETANDFSQGAVIYTITSESGITTDWNVDVSLYVGLETIENNTSLNIFPNPNKGIFTVSFDQSFIKTVNIEIVNTKGQMVANFDEVNSKVSKSINLNELANGIYYLKVYTEKETIVKKINILK